MRLPHNLKGNRNTELPWEAVWFDTETDQVQVDHNTVKHVLRFGWAAYCRRHQGGRWSRPVWFRFTDKAQLWDWIESLLHGRGRLYMFAHNQGFDLPVVGAFTELPARGWTMTGAVIECPPVIVSWRRGNYTITAVDTLNIWRMPLADIGEQMRVHKLRMPGPTSSARRWDAYCRRDVRVIMRACFAWWEFIRRHDLGSFAPTLASQAFRAFRHRFMRHRIYIDDNDDALALARKAYMGGRVECSRIGRVEGPIYRLDINSQYPAVMRDGLMPTVLRSYTERAGVMDLHRWLQDACVVADVVVDTPSPDYPVLHMGKLIFPINRFRARLCGPELRHALERGRVRGVLSAAVYDGAVIFREFVDYFWGLRLDAMDRGDKPEAWRLKIAANSLYGKFGQCGRVYMPGGPAAPGEVRAWIELDTDTHTTIHHRALGGLHQVFVDEGESRDSHPAIAAHVTSYARMLLLALMEEAGRDHVYYVDTDGLAVDQVGYDRLAHHVDARRLGALKLESTEDWGVYRGPKDYTYPSMTKIKGVRKRAHWIGTDSVIQEKWSTLKGLVRKGDLSGPTTTLDAKNLSRYYAKGLRTPGGRVLPYSLDLSQQTELPWLRRRMLSFP